MGVFDTVVLDHLRLYVEDLDEATARYSDTLGLPVHSAGGSGGARSAGVGHHDVRLVLTRPVADGHPGAGYLERHGEGVAEIALRVPDAAAALAVAESRGARVVDGPVRTGDVVTAAVEGFGDVRHVFVQRPDGHDARSLPELRRVARTAPTDRGLVDVDHLAVCLEPGTLGPTVRFYEQVLDFEVVFAERIEVGAQAMDSTVVQSRSGGVTLTLIEPDRSRAPGQIDEFLRSHGGAGVQHIAFRTDDITSTIDSMAAAGVEFLSTPATYYSRLAGRLTPVGHSIEELARRSVLVDEDNHGQMFQIFARSVHPRRTIFVEVIERLRARTFGSSNVTALYEAVELQRGGDEAAA